MSRPWVAFYAPMKAPSHPVPSGDREIARLTLRALAQAGFEARTVSELRIFDGAGDQATQAALHQAATREIDRILAAESQPPALWFTYHCHYKAPDLIGPIAAQRLGVPYVISEPSLAPRRRDGPWSGFATASEKAIHSADLLLWMTERDRPALTQAGLGDRMTHLPAFVDPGPPVPARPAGAPLRLLVVAMMRPGDKLESYRRLAAGLRAFASPCQPQKNARHPVASKLRPTHRTAAPAPNPPDWRLDIHGDGPARQEVEALFKAWPDQVTLHGATDAAALRQAYEAADILVWPGVGEGVGMVYLEAQAAGLPVVAEDHAAQRSIVFGTRVPPDDPVALAGGIRHAAANRKDLGALARQKVDERHSLEAAAALLRRALAELPR